MTQESGSMTQGSSQHYEGPGISLGMQRVRASFNPSANSTVDKIKELSANLIDLCETLKSKDGRLVALAQTHYEDACMWAVKAATTP